jgi:NifU homolog involved in Fe-S cluster formation
MTDELYHQAILDRAKAAHRAGRLEAPDASVTIDNPLCGDRVTMDLRLGGDRIADLSHHVRGCVLCQAAASVIGEHAVGATVEMVNAAEDALRAMLRGDSIAVPWPDLSVFSPVKHYRSRHDCVLLPFEALRTAIAEARKKGP